MKKAIIPERMTASVALAGKRHSISTATQHRLIIEYLEPNSGGLNYIEAVPLGITRLSARISELKDRGFTFLIVKERAQDHCGQWHDGVARYFLTGHPAKEAA